MNRKKLMAMVLSTAMAFSMTTPVLAENVEQGADAVIEEEPVGEIAQDAAIEEDNEEETVEEELVGTDISGSGDVGSLLYQCGSEGTFTLTADSTVETAISIWWGRSITIDLAGYNLDIQAAIDVADHGTFEIKDSAGGGTVSGTDNVSVASGGSFTNSVTETEVTPTPVAALGTDEPVAKIGETEYTTLQLAVDAASSGDTIVLLKAVDISETGLDIPSGKNVTLDLADVNAVTLSDGSVQTAIRTANTETGQITVEGTLTVTDSDEYVSYIATFDDLTDSSASYAMFSVSGSGVLNINDGFLKCTGSGAATGGHHVIRATDQAKINFTNSSRQHGLAVGLSYAPVVLEGSSTLSMSGGAIWAYGNANAVEYSSDGSSEISGDAFLRSGGLEGQDGASVVGISSGSLAVSGGRLRTDTATDNISASGTASVSITGGYFKQDIADSQIASGYSKTTADIEVSGNTEPYYTVSEGTAPTETPTPTPAEKQTVSVKYLNLTTEGKIGVNIYLSIPSELAGEEGAFVEKTFGGTSERELIRDLSATGSGDETIYSVTQYVYAKQMHDPIQIAVYNGSGQQQILTSSSGKEYTDDVYSKTLSSYLESTAGRTSNTKLAALCGAMNVYGTYAQILYNYDTATATATDDLSDVTASDLASYVRVKSGTLPDGLKLASLNVTMTEDTTLTIYYTASDISKYTFTVDGEAVTPVLNGNYYEVAVKNIAAKDLDVTHAFAATDGTNTYTYSVSALTYAYNVLNSSSSKDASKNAVRALYKYCVAAKEYFS